MADDPWAQAAKEYRGVSGAPGFDKGLPARTPGEDWKMWQADSTSGPESGGFLGNLWSEVKSGPANLLGVGNAITNTVLHPIKTLESMGQQNIDMAKQTRNAFKEGNVGLGIRKAVNTGINAVVPGLGRSSEDAGEMFDRGDIAGGLGKTAGIGINTFLGAKTPQIMEGAAKLPTTIKNAVRVDPRIAVNRALRPVPSDPGFPEHTPQSLAAIKEANNGVNPATITNGKLDMIDVSNKAISQHQAALDKWLARAKGVRVSGDELVNATQQAIPELMWTRDPAGARALIQQAQDAFGGKMFTVDQFRTFLKSENADLSAFYKRAPGVQADAAVAGTPPGIEAAQTQRIRDVLYKALDPEGDGAGPRTIQARTGDLYAKRDAALRRNNAIVAEQPLTPIGKVVDPIKAAIRSVLPGKATGAGIAFAEGSEGRSLPLLRRAFDAVGDSEKLPLPGTELYPTGDSTRLLPPGSPQIEAPPDASGVRSYPGMGSLTPERRAIAPGRGTVVTPPPADTSGVTVTTGEPLRAPVSRQLQAGPSVRTPSDLSGQAGDITDLVPVKDPLTGKIEYIPRPTPVRGNIQLPHYAKGGIIRSPQILVDAKTRKPTGLMAEAGPEAIVPLGGGVTADAPTVPKPDAIMDQLGQLSDHKRRVVMIPKGTFPHLAPDGMVTHHDQSGNRFVFNPHLIGIHDIKVAIASHALPRILGTKHGGHKQASTLNF